jgi:uncharacterized protein (UPF0335 family)
MAAPQDGPSSPNGGHGTSTATLLERLPALAGRIGSAKAKVDEARGEVGGLYSQAEADGYHRRALKEAIRLGDMEPAKLRDYLTELNRYCEVLGVFAQGELFEAMPRPPAPGAETPIATSPSSSLGQALGLVDPLADAEAQLDKLRTRKHRRNKAADERQDPVPSAEHRAQGRADALQGFNETKNPWPEGSRAYTSYHQGWTEGNAEFEAQRAKLPKRRSRRKPDEPQLGV